MTDTPEPKKLCQYVRKENGDGYICHYCKDESPRELRRACPARNCKSGTPVEWRRGKPVQPKGRQHKKQKR